MRVIGTAGHVDHGKSTLVQRLTGINPDRLAEEKAREMTIDLGFAWLTLPGSETIGIVDVPGHRDFIENMLAGVGGIDAALLIIAADEGVMPQTLEHLAILDLLDVHNAMVALTKVDLVDDPEWLDLIESDIMALLSGTKLADVPIVRVSAYSGYGISSLIEQLQNLLNDIPLQADFRQPRLPVDRVFTITGFGTVVTGTLSNGTLNVGEEIEFQPSGIRGRIRGLQSYHQQIETALPGSRVAVNVSGVEKSDIHRGEVLSHPGQIRATSLVDAYIRYLPDAGRNLRHQTQVKFFSGAAESLAKIRLLNDEELVPGIETWVQIQLETPIPLTQGDRFILRYPSPAQTIGGGQVVNANPGRRWRRFRPQVIADLETRMAGSPEERLLQAADQFPPRNHNDLQRAAALTDTEFNNALSNLLNDASIMALPDKTYLTTSRMRSLYNQAESVLQQFHRADPLKAGMPREELRSRLGISNPLLNTLLQLDDRIADNGKLLRASNHEISFTPQQTQAVNQLRDAFERNPYSPPSYAEACEITGEPLLRALIDMGEIVQVQPQVIFTEQAYRTMIDGVLEMIDTTGEIDAKALRDRFGSSRKYAIGMLEHLDGLGITRRVGDVRVRGPKARK